MAALPLPAGKPSLVLIVLLLLDGCLFLGELVVRRSLQMPSHCLPRLLVARLLGQDAALLAALLAERAAHRVDGDRLDLHLNSHGEGALRLDCVGEHETLASQMRPHINCKHVYLMSELFRTVRSGLTVSMHVWEKKKGIADTPLEDMSCV